MWPKAHHIYIYVFKRKMGHIINIIMNGKYYSIYISVYHISGSSDLPKITVRHNESGKEIRWTKDKVRKNIRE